MSQKVPESLPCVATYRRTVAASIDRVWENVLDWEHLPWLHRDSFTRIECEQVGDWGWRARVGIRAGGVEVGEITTELRVDRPAGRYVARTVEGGGKGSEIWTRLVPRSETETDVEVEFCLADVKPEHADATGAAFVRLYTRLWDEDESMMVRRQALLDERGERAGRDERAERGSGERVELGPLDAVREKLPMLVQVGGRPFRLLELEGELFAHSAICPHRLGPLDAGQVEGRTVRCPWHGYEYDVATGRSCDGKKLRLAPAPAVEIDAKGGVSLVAS